MKIPYKIKDQYTYYKHNPLSEYNTIIKKIHKTNNFIYIETEDKSMFKVGIVKNNKFYPRLP